MGGKTRVGLSNSIHRTLEDLAPVLDQHRGSSIVIGGIAVIARGVPRVTRDVDVAFSGAEVTLSELLTDLNAAGIVPRIDDAIGFAAQSQVLLARHVKTGVDVDVSLAWLPFEMEAISAASPTMLGAARLPVAQPEDLVIYKAVAWRPQDQQDIERLLALHGAHMDLSRIRRHVQELGEAMEEDRIQSLDSLILRVLGR
jgi:Nucleotidyl transferase of unknown function (DUF2204)